MRMRYLGGEEGRWLGDGEGQLIFGSSVCDQDDIPEEKDSLRLARSGVERP
jgi:hypothetical protein